MAKGIFRLGLLPILLLWTAPVFAGFTVNAGWDLFTTNASETSFPGLGSLMGVPLGTFNFDNTFGRGIGTQSVGNADTVIERTTAATASPAAPTGTGTASIMMAALQLETVTPVNFSSDGTANYFVTLQSGTPTTGSLAITWGGPTSGTFTSTLDLYYDIRKGSLTGTIVDTGNIVLTSSATSWSDLPPGGSTTIPNVNRFLSGTSGDPSQDFWPNGGLIEANTPNLFSDGVGDSTPEPATLSLLVLAIPALFARPRRAR